MPATPPRQPGRPFRVLVLSSSPPHADHPMLIGLAGILKHRFSLVRFAAHHDALADVPYSAQGTTPETVASWRALLGSVDAVLALDGAPSVVRQVMMAQACGVPVVAVDNVVWSGVMVDGETGWRLPPDPATLAKALVDMAADPDQHMDMALTARAHAIGSLDINLTARRYLDAYHAVLMARLKPSAVSLAPVESSHNSLRSVPIVSMMGV